LKGGTYCRGSWGAGFRPAPFLYEVGQSSSALRNNSCAKMTSVEFPFEEVAWDGKLSWNIPK